MHTDSLRLRRLIVSALLLAIALVFKTLFTFYIPLFGQNGMRIGVSGIFSMIPSFLFGPWYGAAVSGLSDLLGYLLKPTGAYIPLLTLTAALGGFLRGGLFSLLKGRRDKPLRLATLIFSLLMLFLGLAVLHALRADGVDAAYYQRVSPDQGNLEGLRGVSRLLIQRTQNMKNPAEGLATYITFLTWGPVGFGVMGLLLLVGDLLVERFLKGAMVSVLAMLTATTLSGLVVTTLNTLILRETVYASWKVLPLLVVLLPRIIEEITMGAAKVLLIGVLMRGAGIHPDIDKWLAMLVGKEAK